MEREVIEQHLQKLQIQLPGKLSKGKLKRLQLWKWPVGRYYYGTGRRKTAVARVRLYPADEPLQEEGIPAPGVSLPQQGEGGGPPEPEIMINGRPFREYFPVLRWQERVLEPLKVTQMLGKFRIWAKVEGGGVSGQADAVRLGISRALLAYDESLRPTLRKQGLLTVDARQKERRKYGHISARKQEQYRKR